jgi:hypothetical protein
LSDQTTDTGHYVIPEGSWGVLWHPETGWSLVTVPRSKQKTQVPEEALALTMAFIKLEREPDYRAAMAGEFIMLGKK